MAWRRVLTFVTSQSENRTDYKNCRFKMMRKVENILRYALLMVAFLVPIIASAQEDSVSYRRDRSDHKVSVDFRVNSSTIDPNYRNNRTMISRVDSLFNNFNADSTIIIEAVEFSGSASPEGNVQLNSRLSRARMKAVENYVRKHISISQDVITYNDRLVDWDHLVESVEADTTLTLRDEVLKICRGTYPGVKGYNGVTIDGRIPEIKRLDNGKTWNELLKRYFVKMRTGTITFKTYVDVPVIIERPKPEPDESVIEEEEDVLPENLDQSMDTEAMAEDNKSLDSTDMSNTEISALDERKPLMSVKTNLLAYTTLIPNIGLEFRLANHWSAEITGLYSPFDLFRYNRKTRVLATKPELRYWFREAMCQGHFVGVHMPIAGFNIQLQDDFRYQDARIPVWGVGLTYGYSLHLGKQERWCIDFAIGFGYLNIQYNIYEGIRNGKFVRSEQKYYIGPTRVGIELSYLINRKRGK